MSFAKVIPGNQLSANVTPANNNEQQGLKRMGIDGNIYEWVMVRSAVVAGQPLYRVSQLGAANSSTNGMMTPTQSHSSLKRAYGVAVGTVTAGNFAYALRQGIPAHLRTKSTATLKGLLLAPYLKLWSTTASFSTYGGQALQTPASSDLAYGSLMNLL